MNPLISIIIPVYNLEQTIKRTLDSVLVQTYQAIEIIVVNDGSKDETGAIIDSYAAQNREIIAIHTQNQGVTAARLTGVKYASGEWIGFVDGDDEIEPDMYEMLLNNALQYEADISHCGYQMIFPDGRISYFHNTGCLVMQDKLTGLKDLLDGSLVEPGLWNKLFHKKLFYDLLHTEIIDKKIKINEDLLMNYILFSKSKLSIFQDICKYHYLVRSNSTSRSSLNEHKIFDPIRVKGYILNMNIDGMLQSAQKAYMSTCINVYNSLVLDKSTHLKKNKKEVWNLIYEHRKWIIFLSKKQKILANFIIACPIGYKPIYRFYAKYLMQSHYE